MNSVAPLDHIVIVGATSAIAEQCARLWMMRRPARLSLVGRNASRLTRIVDDLSVRSPETRIAAHELANFNDPLSIDALVRQLATASPITIALIAHGALPDQAVCQGNTQACTDALLTNGVSPALFVQAFVTQMEAAGHGTVAAIGSVSGDRGRASNYLYGAGKALLARQMEGLQHRLALRHSPVRAVLIKPGPTDTPMTAHLRAQGARLASAKDVAHIVVRAIDRGSTVAYAPGRWRWIMGVIRHLPRFIFNHLNI